MVTSISDKGEEQFGLQADDPVGAFGGVLSALETRNKSPCTQSPKWGGCAWRMFGASSGGHAGPALSKLGVLLSS